MGVLWGQTGFAMKYTIRGSGACRPASSTSRPRILFHLPHPSSPRHAHSRRRDLRHSASAYRKIKSKSLIGIFPGWQCYGIAYALGCVGHELVHINQWWSDLRCVCQASVFRYNSISILKNPATLLTGILTKSSHSPDGVLCAHAL